MDGTPVVASGALNVKTLYGWNFAENSNPAADARVLFRNGGAAGEILLDLRLGAKESAGDNYAGDSVLSFPDGLYVDVSAGAVRGAVWGG